MLHRALASLLAAAVFGAPVAAHAQPASPIDERVKRAMELYEQADLAGALEQLEQAYALMPQPQIAFAMAKIHMERGECAKAIARYRAFLESKPGPSSTQIATDAIAQCQKILVASGEPLPPDPGTAPAPAGEPTPREAPAAPAAVEPRTRPWYTDPVGDALVVAGTGGLILGGVLALSARTDVSRANQGGAGGVSLEEYDQLADDADRKQQWAAIAAGAGGALIVGGIIRYLTGDRTETITVEPASGAGATVHAAWRF